MTREEIQEVKSHIVKWGCFPLLSLDEAKALLDLAERGIELQERKCKTCNNLLLGEDIQCDLVGIYFDDGTEETFSCSKWEAKKPQEATDEQVCGAEKFPFKVGDYTAISGDSVRVITQLENGRVHFTQWMKGKSEKGWLGRPSYAAVERLATATEILKHRHGVKAGDRFRNVHWDLNAYVEISEKDGRFIVSCNGDCSTWTPERILASWEDFQPYTEPAPEPETEDAQSIAMAIIKDYYTEDGGFDAYCNKWPDYLRQALGAFNSFIHLYIDKERKQ